MEAVGSDRTKRAGVERMSKYVPLTPSSPNAIQRFSDLGIEEAMKSQLDKLPKGKRGAIVMYADGGGVRGAVYGRKPGRLWFLPPGDWSYSGTLGVDYKGKLEGAAAVGYSW